MICEVCSYYTAYLAPIEYRRMKIKNLMENLEIVFAMTVLRVFLPSPVECLPQQEGFLPARGMGDEEHRAIFVTEISSASPSKDFEQKVMRWAHYC